VTQLEWRQAMGCEFDALMENGSWSLCPIPHNKHVVRNKNLELIASIPFPR